MAMEAKEALYTPIPPHPLTRLPEIPLYSMARHSLMATLFMPPHPGDISPSIQVIQGMGGMGKSLLALMYAQKYASTKAFVRWIPADTNTLQDEWRQLGILLGLDIKGKLGLPEYQAIQTALQQYESWLIILDNLTDKKVLSHLLPKKLLPTQHILITTRSMRWKNYSVLSLPPFTPEECNTYLGIHLSSAQCVDIEKLAKTLRYIPLALFHAATSLQHSHITTEDYLTWYTTKYTAFFLPESRACPQFARSPQKALILEHRSAVYIEVNEQRSTENQGFMQDIVELRTRPIQNEESYDARHNMIVFITCHILLEQLAAKNPLAAELAKYCAYLHPEYSMKSLLKKICAPYQTVIQDRIFDTCIHDIQDYALLSKSNIGLHMHRLVQASIRREEAIKHNENLHIKRFQSITYALYQDYPYQKQKMDYNPLPHLKTMIGHVNRHIAKTEENKKTIHICKASLLHAIGNFYQHILKSTEEAIAYHRESLLLRIHLYKEIYFEVAINYHDLSAAYKDMGDVQNHLFCQQKYLWIYLQLYGKKNIDFSKQYHTLGMAHMHVGNKMQALACQKKAFSIHLKFHGARKDAYLALRYTYLGIAHHHLNHFKLASLYHKEALDIYVQLHTERHTSVAACYTHLGNIYADLKESATAQYYLRKALEIYTQLRQPQDMQEVIQSLRKVILIMRPLVIQSQITPSHAYPGRFFKVQKMIREKIMENIEGEKKETLLQNATAQPSDAFEIMTQEKSF